MKVKKRLKIVVDVMVDEDLDTNFLYLCQDVGDQINMGSVPIFVGQSEDFEVLDYVSWEEV